MLVPHSQGGLALAAADTPDVLLEPVKRSRIYEHIVQQIRALIREGRWAPGDQIPPERELAERFQVSRTSVREALRAADNHILLRLHNVILDLLRESRQSYLHVPDRPQTSLRGHEAILQAVKMRDPERAYAASLEHITEVRDGILRALETAPSNS